MALEVDSSYNRRVLELLVRCDSVNPAFEGADGQPGRGEADIASRAADLLRELGLEVYVHESAPGRPSVVGLLRGSGGGHSLMLNGHLDTVGPGNMERPFEPRVENGRLHGRGAFDMKAGLAACLGALRALAGVPDRLRGDLIVSLVADEEDASLGTSDLVGRYGVDGAIVTEPTDLRLCLAHKGFTWIKLTTEGLACHGSDFEHGVDANLRMGRVLAGMAQLETELRARPGHDLVGPPSLHAPLVSGGAGPSIYSPACTAQLERRTVPGESPEGVAAEVRQVVGGLSEKVSLGRVGVEEVLSRAPFEAKADSHLAAALSESFEAVEGRRAEIAGVPFWTDAALFRAAGADTVVFGPSGTGAHADVEWVDLQSVDTVAAVLARVAVSYCGGESG